MLDPATRKRIDDCRDILVGKLPDPKAQIEQITIGLIYKFMDDMDREAVELGGAAKFFTNYTIPDPEDATKTKTVEFEKYAWNRLFDAKTTATEMLALYAEAIAGMDKNPNIPALFREIFKNAFLPYRDPETLKLFLKTIGEFEYTHSEKLGDAFEYLLSVMGSQGDAGQFRTPRHIIDFLVAVVDPGKNDTILDPACGTAGFLISAFKHIAGFDSAQPDRKALTPDERKRLIQHVTGYDISPDMVRLSLVNLYLHGFSDPHIVEYDTLSSEERWAETFDVVLANPPFMSPKGGIRPHKRFTISSNRSEVLFVDYIAEHLAPKGRAGIIVPEGVIFQSGKAYKELRKMLVDGYLYAVVSLPAGVFNPYSGVKTSILLMDKALAKQRDEILFVKIDNDGYNLGAQRNAVKGGQLNKAVALIHAFAQTSECPENELTHAVAKTEIAKNGEYNLSGERYRVATMFNSKFPIVKIEDVCKINPLKSQIRDLSEDLEVSFLPMADLNENQINFEAKQSKILGEVFSGYTYFQDNDVLIAKVTPCFENGKAGIAKNLINGIGFGSSEFYVLRTNDKIKSDYLYRVLSTEKFKAFATPKMTGTGGLRRVPKNVLAEFQIPLPPLAIQEEIVAEIEGYQKIIDGAKAVLKHYKPKIDIDPDWEMVELGEVCEIKSGGTPDRGNNDYWNGNIPYIKTGQIFFNKIYEADEFITEEGLNNSSTRLIPSGTILMAMYGQGVTRGRVAVLEIEAAINQAVAAILIKKDKIVNQFLYYQLQGLYEYLREISDARGGNQSNLNSKLIKELKIRIPPLETQRQIVAQIEKEQALVNANKELIEIFEQKIKERIAKVWGTSTDTSAEITTVKMPVPAPTESALPMAAESEVQYGLFD